MASPDAFVPRTRYYQPFSKGPWVVFFRPKDKPLKTLDISRDLLRRYPGISVFKERFNKLRVQAPTFDVANKIVDHEAFRIEYNIYIPSRDVEIDGVVTDASLSVEDLKRASGSFKNSMMATELVKIVGVQQMRSVSLVDGKRVFQHTDSFKVSFAGSALPNFVKLDGAFFPVRLFVQKVYNCTNCQRLGHTASYCHNKTRCGKCGENHKEDSCPKEAAKCAYCGENPHPVQECPMYKQRSEKVQRSIEGRSKRTYAQMLKAASAVQDQNQFSVLPVEESDSDESDGGVSTGVQTRSQTKASQKRKCPSPKVYRKKTKVTPKRLKNSQGNGEEKTRPKAPDAPIPGCSKDFPPLPKKDNNIKNKKAPPQSSQKKPKSDRGLIAFSDIVEFIFNMFNIQDPLRSLVSALLPTLENYLKQLTVSWPLLASIISFDG